MSVLNAAKRFRHCSRETGLITKHPKRVREAFNIWEVAEDGIFLIDEKEKIYDRCYRFSDVNYINKNDDEKKNILVNLMKFLNSMSVHFKVTVSNEYRNTQKFIKEISKKKNREKYPVIAEGLDRWVDEKIKEGELRDLVKVMYLTITVRAQSREEARTYFLNMDAQLERLFQSMDSILKPLNGLERLESLRVFFHPEETGYPIRYDFENKRKDPMNSVLPVCIEQEKDWMVLGERYATVMFAREYASSLDEGKVLQGFSGLPFISLLTIDYAPVDKRLLMEMLEAAHLNNEKSIAQEEDSKRSRGHFAVGISYRKERRKFELEDYTDRANNNNESCFLVSMYFVITADTEEELATRIHTAKNIGRENGVYLEPCNFTQLKALNTALPNGCRNITYPRSFLTSSLVALQPFKAQELQDPGGIFYGINRTTGHLVFANIKYLISPHCMIIGHTGSGKSFFVKVIIIQVIISTDDDVIIIDPQNEMRDLCRELCGQFLDLTPRSGIYMNPLEIPDDVVRNEDEMIRNKFIADQTKWLRSFCSAAMKNIVLTAEHYSLIGRAVRELYESCFSQKKVNTQPTLKDVREIMKRYMDEASSSEDADLARKLYNSLEEYTEGSFDLFAHESNVDINNRFVVFGLAKVPQELWEPVMITIMHFLSNRMEYNRKLQKPTRLIIDETQEVCRNQLSAEMLLHSVRTFRKFGGVVTMMLQNLTSILENPELRDMFSNCGYKYFLDQGGVDAEALRSIQELSNVEFESLCEDRPGCGVLVWGKKVILLDSVMSKDNPLYERLSTNFHEKEKSQRFLKENDEYENESPVDLRQAILNLTETVSITQEEAGITLGIAADKAVEILKSLEDEGKLECRLTDGERRYFKANGTHTEE